METNIAPKRDLVDISRVGLLEVIILLDLRMWHPTNVSYLLESLNSLNIASPHVKSFPERLTGHLSSKVMITRSKAFVVIYE